MVSVALHGGQFKLEDRDFSSSFGRLSCRFQLIQNLRDGAGLLYSVRVNSRVHAGDNASPSSKLIRSI